MRTSLSSHLSFSFTPILSSSLSYFPAYVLSFSLSLILSTDHRKGFQAPSQEEIEKRKYEDVLDSNPATQQLSIVCNVFG